MNQSVRAFSCASPLTVCVFSLGGSCDCWPSLVVTSVCSWLVSGVMQSVVTSLCVFGWSREILVPLMVVLIGSVCVMGCRTFVRLSRVVLRSPGVLQSVVAGRRVEKIVGEVLYLLCD